VIPGTLLGALFLAACLVPGFVFLRVGERRRARAPRSSLIEAVELAGVGAAASLVSVTVVLSVGRTHDFLDASALANDAGTYLLEHAVRGPGSLLVSFALSCALAWLAARIVFATRQSVFEPGGSTWGRVFLEDRPRSDDLIYATLELTDGRRLRGYLHSFTSELEDSRELALRGPLQASTGAADPLEDMGGDFILIREDQIATITGVYVSLGEATGAANKADESAAPSAESSSAAY
jgi:hypothetical protein